MAFWLHHNEITPYVIANNHFRGQAACNALEIKNKVEGQPVKVPEPLLATYPQLKAIAAG